MTGYGVDWERRQYNAIVDARRLATDPDDYARRLRALCDNQIRERIRLRIELDSAFRELTALKGEPTGAPRFEATWWTGWARPFHLVATHLEHVPKSLAHLNLPDFEVPEKRCLCGAERAGSPHLWPRSDETCPECVAIAARRPAQEMLLLNEDPHAH